MREKNRKKEKTRKEKKVKEWKGWRKNVNEEVYGIKRKLDKENSKLWIQDQKKKKKKKKNRRNLKR